MAEIPSHQKKWYENKWVAEAIASVPPIIAALYSAYAAYQNPQTAKATPILLVSALWLLFGGLWKVGIARRDDQSQSPKNPLYAAVWVVRAAVAAASGIEDGDADALRVTVHRVVKPNNNPREIEQLCAYVGGTGGAPGRRFPIQSGVAGRAATTGKPTGMGFEKRSSIQDRIAELTQYGYNKDDATAIVAKDRLSFFAVPISSPSRTVIAVVYLDSKREKFFDAANSALIINACGGIASYLTEQYR
jgi:hypothetical protein